VQPKEEKKKGCTGLYLEQNVFVYCLRGGAYHERKDYNKAIEDYTKAIDLDPNYARAYSSRGDAYHCKENYNKAIEDYTKAIALDPNLANAYFERGCVYVAKNFISKAIEDFSQVIRLKPDNSDAYGLRGILYCNVDKSNYSKSLAVANLMMAMKLGPDNPKNGEYQEWLEKAKKSDDVFVYDQAFVDATLAIFSNPDDARGYYNRGLVCQKTDWNKDLAIADFEMAVKLDPDNSEFREKLAKGKANQFVGTFSGVGIVIGIGIGIGGGFGFGAIFVSVIIGAIVGAIVGRIIGNKQNKV
jgi:tetratricopeptide (TPR) repeat protein